MISKYVTEALVSRRVMTGVYNMGLVRDRPQEPASDPETPTEAVYPSTPKYDSLSNRTLHLRDCCSFFILKFKDVFYRILIAG